MAINLSDVAAQTFVFPASASATNLSDDIYLCNGYEIVGFLVEAMETNTAKIRLRGSLTSPNTTTGVFYDVVDKAYAVTELVATGTEMASGVTLVRLPPDQFIIGPIRLQLEAYQSDGSTAVNQDGQVVTPIYRRMK
jgi:hypothetical protein